MTPRVFLVEKHYPYEGGVFVGVFATLKSAKAGAVEHNDKQSIQFKRDKSLWRGFADNSYDTYTVDRVRVQL